MRSTRLALALAALTAWGCFYSVPQPPPPQPTTMNAWGPFGGFSLNSGGGCAGQVTLTNGVATVHDPCFTDDTNVVICSDSTAAYATRCAASQGSLSVSGNANDVIGYARVR
ncbi:MAG TPA: hypothetical protein VEF03_13525 [Candidatus Binataceae bacterium]|nr:hypothetical protein [Candidatus Binataceae bacterium]